MKARDVVEKKGRGELEGGLPALCRAICKLATGMLHRLLLVAAKQSGWSQHSSATSWLNDAIALYACLLQQLGEIE